MIQSSARNLSKHLMRSGGVAFKRTTLSELDKKVILIRQLVDRFYYSQNREFGQDLSLVGLKNQKINLSANMMTNSSSTNNNSRSYSSSTSPSEKKILLVDGTPLVVRAYFGTPPLTS